MGERTSSPPTYIVKVIKTIGEHEYRKLRSFILENTGSGHGPLKDAVPPDVFHPEKGLCDDFEVIIAETPEGKTLGCVGINPEPGHPHNVFGLVTARELGERRYLLGHVLLAHALRRALSKGLNEVRATPIRRALPFFTGIRADPAHVYKEMEIRVRLWRRARDDTLLDLTLVSDDLRRELLLHGVRTLNAERRLTPFSHIDDHDPVHRFRSGVKAFTLVAGARE